MILGLTGTNGSGKDTVADFLVKEKGYAFHSLSDAIRDSLKTQNKESTRENCIQEGNRLREEGGPGVLGELIAGKVRAQNPDNAVIVSIRNLKELEVLRSLPGFRFVFVDAPIELRFERISARGDERDKETFESFKEKEDRELAGEADTVQQLGKCRDAADDFNQ